MEAAPEDRTRARRVVRLAATKTETQAEWLRRDERGTWERKALDYLRDKADRAAALGMSAEDFDDAIATQLALLAVTSAERCAAL